MFAVLLVLSVVAEPGGAQGKTPHTAPEAEVRAALNAGGPAFDACTRRYLQEYPGTTGAAQIDFQVGSVGKVVKAKVDTRLVGARNLRPCLESAAKAIKFPAPGEGRTARLSLTVPVEKGVRFRIYDPGEAPPPSEPKQVRTAFRFLPGDWSSVGPAN